MVYANNFLSAGLKNVLLIVGYICITQVGWFEVQGSKFKVRSSRFKVQGSKFKVQSSRFKVQE
jgi:hypothetical protein